MELFIFGRFHVREGEEDMTFQALLEVSAASRKEAGCAEIHGFRCTRDPRLFYIHSRWRSEEAFELHAGLPHTVRFIDKVAGLVDQPVEVTRAEMIA